MRMIMCQPPGWRMIDRFYGFRYEIQSDGLDKDNFTEAVQKQADVMGCFGWVQRSNKGTFVGEARCTKAQGPKFQSWLAQGPQGSNIANIEVHVYDDTKIRLHFAYFKILDETRDTCFLDPPHQCSEISTPGPENNQAFKSDELVIDLSSFSGMLEVILSVSHVPYLLLPLCVNNQHLCKL
eukprot:gene4073-8103_t